MALLPAPLTPCSRMVLPSIVTVVLPPAAAIATWACEIGGRYVGIGAKRVVGRQVKQILVGERTVAVGVEVGDDVIAEARREDEGIAVASARHPVVAGTTNQDIVATAAIERVIAGAAVESVGAVLTGQDVVAAA